MGKLTLAIMSTLTVLLERYYSAVSEIIYQSFYFGDICSG